MRTILPPIPTSRISEADETFDSLLQDLAGQTGASTRAIRKAIRASGAEDRLKRLCLALLDHAGLSRAALVRKGGPARRRRRRAA